MPGYDVVAARGTPEAAWDAFVEATPGGTHQQTSMWTEVKATLGWGSAYVLLYDGDTIVGGCQLLLQRLAAFGAVAYAPRGPVLADHGSEALDAILAALHRLAVQERILYLMLQPPDGHHDAVAQLELRGYRASSVQLAPRATVRVHLERPANALLGSMRSSTRTKIRQAQRRGVTVREGGEADLGTFLHLIEQTSRRQGFPLYPRRYYEQVWRSFAACDRTVLLFAEHGGQPLASSLLIACGDTVGYKMGGWSGERSNIRPNELLHWTGMQWARERGYRFYDFEGIDWSVARALMAGDRGPFHAPRQGVTNFKLGFGGDLRVFPGTYGYSYRPLLGGALRWAAPKLERSTLALTLVKRAVARDGWRGRLPSATG